MRAGPNPIKLFSASFYVTLKMQPIREAQRGRVTTLIGQNFSVASIEAEKSFIGLGPGMAHLFFKKKLTLIRVGKVSLSASKEMECHLLVKPSEGHVALRGPLLGGYGLQDVDGKTMLT